VVVLDFVRGAAAGLAVCLPPGIVSALCVTRSVRRGFGAGFSLAAGAALGDAVYAGIAAYGLESVRHAIGDAARVVAVVAAPLLFWAGTRLLRRARRVAEDLTASDAAKRPASLLRSVAAGFAIAAAAPGTLAGFVLLFAALGAGDAVGGPASPAAMTAGALCGALGWWAALASVARRFRTRVTGGLRFLDAAAGAMLVVASVAAAFVAITGAPISV
jgi:putative LysE/RhtB family amino acid efflux pump